jgi:hypothetical protein
LCAKPYFAPNAKPQHPSLPPVADQLCNLPFLRAQADAASATAALFTGIRIQLTQARAMREIGWIPHRRFHWKNSPDRKLIRKRYRVWLANTC